MSSCAGGMVGSSLSHLEQRFSCSGTSAQNANPTIMLPTTSAPSVGLRTTLLPHRNASNYNKIVMALNADGFNILPHRYNLTSRYPNLSWNLHNSFPLGEFDALHESFNHPNHSNSDYVNDYILKYIEDEVSGGCMSGPFTWDELKKEV
jgi:hypothetical protein